MQTIVCHAITVMGQTMNFHDYCHGSCDYWIPVGKCVMVHANTGHGCQGHVLSRFDDLEMTVTGHGLAEF